MASMLALFTGVIATGLLYSITGSSAAPAALGSPSFLAVMKELEEFVPRERRDTRRPPSLIPTMSPTTLGTVGTTLGTKRHTTMGTRTRPTPKGDKVETAGKGNDGKSSTDTDTALRLRGLRVTSTITARFAKTVVTCHVTNPASQGQEVNFYIELPKEAFISGFLIETEGKVYRSRVDEKEKAKAAYEQAKQQGQTTGHVSQTSEKKNDFTVSINVAAEGALSFNLTYEELLKRHNGYFENVISISPRQLVKHLIVNVYIEEPQGIDGGKMDFFLERPSSTDYEKVVVRPQWAEMKQLQRDRVHVQFHPTTEEQELLASDGVLGKFIVRYDVIHGENAGKIEIVNGYFVHHFSPAGLRPVSKNVVFVLDTSGSMSGTKIRQTKEAMGKILTELREQDNFGLITFASQTTVWRETMMSANKDNIELAKGRISQLRANGRTDLHGGIVAGIDMLEDFKRNELGSDGAFPLIIMLTDGQPTSGRITNTDGIVSDIKSRMEGRFSLFCLGFGNNVDFSFLEKLSLQNRGLARKIYEDADAGLQLVGFFDEVATPLLTNVVIKYENTNNAIQVNSISQSEFPVYFDGTELVVAGKLTTLLDETDGEVSPEPVRIICTVLATSWEDEIILETETEVKNETEGMLSPRSVDDFAQRLWAFLTIKELLRKRSAADGDAEKANLTERALELSLKYHFVTPLTSLVVVKPDEEPVIDGGPIRIQDENSHHRLASIQPVSLRGRYLMQPGPIGPPYRKQYNHGPISVGFTVSTPRRYRTVLPTFRPLPTHSFFMPSTKTRTTTTTVPTTHTTVPKTHTTIPTTHTTIPLTSATTTRTTLQASTRVYENANFLVRDGQTNVTMCFDVIAVPGDNLILLIDPLNDLEIRAQVASALNSHSGNGPAPLIIERLFVNVGRQHIVVSTEQISSADGTFSVPWVGNQIQLDGGLVLSVSQDGARLTLQPSEDISLVVTKHVGRHQEDKADYLGFSTDSGEGFSDSVGGLIGSLVGKEIRLTKDSEYVRGAIRIGGEKRQEVTLEVMRDIREDTAKSCWYSGIKSA
ncbi:inter-alpha-trypsin inhibitor heavy chain H3-like isoform X2 [Asterias amurensis]